MKSKSNSINDHLAEIDRLRAEQSKQNEKHEKQLNCKHDFEFVPYLGEELCVKCNIQNND